MAVEIPVVVDIMGGIDDSIKQLPKAIKKLQTEVDSYPVEAKIRINVEGVEETNDELKQLKEYFQEMEDADWEKIGKDLDFTPYINQSIMELRSLEKQLQEIQDLRQMEGGGTDFAKELADAHKNIREQAAAVARAIAAMEEMQKSFKASGTGINDFINSQYNEVEKRRAQWKALYAELEDYSEKYASSINAIRNRVSELEQTWANMTKAERNAGRDEMLNKYKKEVSELKSEAKTLREIFQEQERLAKLVKQTAQNRRYEAAVLKMNGDSIRILSEQQRILTERLNKAKFGSAQFERLKTQLEEVRQKLQQVQGGVNNVTGAMQKQSGLLRNLTGTLSSYVSVFGALRFAKQIRDVTGELEFQRIALGRLIQDEEYGNKLFDRIKAAAVESPFRIGDLVTYTKQLAAYRIEQENLFDTTRRLADISAGLGVDMNRLILAYGQVRAASVLRGQELRQFTEAGLPLVELLAEKFSELRDESVSTADVFKLISERAVPFSMIADIFEDLTDKGGMFYDMQKKQVETLKGRWEKLKDTFDIALQSIGETKTFERYNNIVLSSLTLLSKHLAVIPKLIEGASVAWLIYYAATTKSRIATKRAAMAEIAEATAKEAQSIANIKGIKNVNAYTAAMIRQRVAANGLERGFWKLWAAIVANPLGAALAAIGAITTALVFWNKRNKEVEQSGVDLNNTIEKLAESTKDYQKVEKLAKRYETLANKTDRSAKENLKLSQTIDALNEKFPDLTLKMDDDTDAIKNNTKAISDNNEQRRKEARLDAERDLKLAEQTLEQQDKQRDTLRKSYEEARDRAASAENLSGTNWQVTYDRYVKEANEAKVLWEKAAAAYNVTLNQVTRLRERLEPTETTSKAWKEQLRDMQLAKNGAQLFSNEAIDGWSRLYDASNDLEKEWKKLKEELDGMRESASKVKPEFMNEWTKDVESLESKLEGLELIRLLFGFAWGKQSTPRGSDTRLSDLKKQISEITNAYKKFLELRKYMSDEAAQSQMSLLFPQFAGERMDMENTLRRLQDMREDVAKKLARSPKDKTLLEMQRTLDTEISNLKFDDLKKKIDDELKRISADIKRSETARNFYNDILGLTGDNELAASLTMSVYGTQGEEFADRIKKQLVDSLSTLDANTFAGLDDAIINAFDEGDYKYLMEHLKDVPETLRDTVKQVASDSEKYNADFIQNMLKTYRATKDFEERITEIRNREANNRKRIQESEIPEGEKQKLLNASTRKEEADVAEVEVERLKSMDEWVSAFENLDKVGTTTLKNLISLIKGLIETSGSEMNAGTLRALTKSLEAAEEQVYHREIFTEFSSGLKSYVSSLKEAASARKKLNSQENKDAATSKRLQNAENNRNKSLEKMKSAVDGLSDVFSNLNSVVSAASELLDLDELSDGQAILNGIATGLGLVGTALVFINGVLTLLETNPIVLAITGIVAGIASIATILSNIRVNRANREIKTQSDLLEDLEYQYGRLEKAIAKSFGSDYITNYNQQLDALAAKQEAYLKQAEAERSKGKKADEDKIKEYTNNARDAADQIRDMQSQLSEFFAGTDVTSAARDFASAWIDAYKEFGSTTDAISEKFQEMVQEMVQNSIAGKVMQELLAPIFSEIDRLAQEGGELSAEDIASISALAEKSLPQINDSMLALMNTLGAAGYNIRRQPGQFTGISRNIANATEESITGLAAGINTQNFYISTISQNVAAILAVISGGNATPAGSAAVPTGVEWTTHVSMINDNLSALLQAFRSVIYTNGQTVNKYIAVRL